MIDDLKIIKKEYGEKMAHLCRELFPIILESKGLLSKTIISKFAKNHFLYDDLIENNMIDEFKNYIYSLVDVENKNEKEVSKSVKELLNEAGYEFYECHSERDIQKFKKYYAPREELCTFNGGRLNRCYVFFAVKKNVDEIKREDFQNPERQDEYGTSVISIQFTRSGHTLSIKNRYNHRVNNPDATFGNNLENIIPGLTMSFEQEYNLKINQNESKTFDLPEYIIADDGKFYKYNYEDENIYFCPDNIIINNGVIEKYDTSRYLLIDYFLIDLKEKTLEDINVLLSDGDSLASSFIDIENIKIVKELNYIKKIIIKQKDFKEEVVIKVDKYNRIIEYINNNLLEIPADFMFGCEYIEKIEIRNVEKIHRDTLINARKLKEIIAPNVKYIGDNILYYNQCLKQLNFPYLVKIGNWFMTKNRSLEELNTPNLLEFGDCLLWYDFKLKKVDCDINLIASNFQTGYIANLFNKRIEEKLEEENEEIKDNRSK